MTWNKVLCLVGLAIASTGFASGATASSLQERSVVTLMRGVPVKIAQFFEPPAGQRGAPSQTVSGGRRDHNHCRGISTTQKISSARGTLDEFLIALIPGSNWGLTTGAYPTFLIYVPKTSAKVGEFVLDDQNLNRLASIRVELKETPAIYTLTPAANTPPLEIGKDYQWAFSLVCDREGVLQDPVVSGLVRRIRPDAALSSKLATASPMEKIHLYARSGIWYEAVTTLASLRRQEPADPKLSTAWNNLLQSVGLGAIAPAPLKK